MPLEQRLIETIRVLAPEKQQAVLEFAEFLQNKQNTESPRPDGPVLLAERGIGTEQAAELRWRFQAIAEDWNRPEMDVYDSHTLGIL